MSEDQRAPQQMTATERQFDLDLDVASYGGHGMLMATSEQMPNLMVSGTDESNLWDCLQPVITSLIEAGGERVQVMTVDRTRGLHAIRVHVQTSAQ